MAVALVRYKFVNCLQQNKPSSYNELTLSRCLVHDTNATESWWFSADRQVLHLQWVARFSLKAEKIELIAALHAAVTWDRCLHFVNVVAMLCDTLSSSTSSLFHFRLKTFLFCNSSPLTARIPQTVYRYF